MAWHHHHQPLLFLMEDPIVHTDVHPFGGIDPTCPCSEDPALIAKVHAAVEQGLMKDTLIIRGKPLWCVCMGQAGHAVRVLRVYYGRPATPLSQLKGVFFP